MKQLFNTIARRLLAHAGARAERAMHKQAQVRMPHQESFASNAGGWN